MYALTLTADLWGVTDLRPDDSEENPFYYMFKVECTSCREVHLNWIGVSRFDSNEISGSKGDANFVWKCKNCQRQSFASIKSEPMPYIAQSPPKPQNLLLIECRGCEFKEFKAEGDWLATGEKTGTKFSGIKLEENEWYDYDEKAGKEVSIKDIKWEVRRA
ncbi:hypothetical protein L211DRAFT_824455 [Terfezia boudieri ATCC MYA-4762]|uniref:DUF866-domain-containing protein n=1 Tax=Terfezia boudieri ATCC MYA-4762 TaxID=1051890 RepID=A0A3N4LTN4_9PEZI|nr:hypothetical protein L211DRAFT_824455 [Terfezia boudieri ATCC MYA-4762]